MSNADAEFLRGDVADVRENAFSESYDVGLVHGLCLVIFVVEELKSLNVEVLRPLQVY